MKKKLISAIMSSFMFVSMFSTGYCTNVKAETINSENNSRQENQITLANEKTLSSSVDNSDTKYFPETLTQLGNSCQSYCMGYYVMTYEYNRLHNTEPTLPENIMSPAWLFNLVNNGRNQGASFSTVLSVLKTNGIVSTKDVPIESLENYPDDDDPYYYDVHARDNIWRTALDNRIKDSFNIRIDNSTNTPITSEKDEDLNEVKKALAEGHIMGFCGYHGGYNFDTIDGSAFNGQPIVTSDKGTSNISHAMTVVGYNDDIWVDINNNGKEDDGEKGAFKVADSYKTSGEDGFFWIAYDALNKTSSVTSVTNSSKRRAAISSEGFYGVILDDNSNNEGVYLEYTLNTSLRNTVKFKVTDTDENEEFTTNLYVATAGQYSYDGTTNASDGKFVLDLSKYNSKFTREKILNDGIKFTITDTKEDYKKTIVKEVYLYDKATNTRIQLNDKYVSLDNDSIELSSKGNNYTTIYYKGSMSTPYIQYKIGDGQWIQAPGVKIGENNSIYGYYYAVKIKLGKETNLTARFNDGNGNWDNNGGKDYTFGTGCYTFNYGTITETSDPVYSVSVTSLEASVPDSIVEGNTVVFNTKTKNERGTVKYKYVLTRADGTQSVLRDYSTYSALSWLTSTPGKYTITVYANDGWTTSFKSINYEVKEFKDVNISSLESSLGTEFNLGKTTTLSMKAQDGYSSSYSYSIKVNDKEILSDRNQTSASFKPTEAGTYTVLATVIDARGQKATKTMTLKVNEVTSNQTTIYYKGYDNPYIHYRIGNGSWTNAPGVKMSSNSDVDGYYYAITLDLGDAEQLTACFNNGNGSWDSNGGKNYTFGTGYYTFSNGVITKIEKPSSELKINSITCSSGSTMKMGSKVDLTVNASGGEGPYTYYLYYYGYGSGRLNYIIKEKSYNTATFSPDYPQKTTIYAEVVDSTGKKVTYSQTFDVKDNTSNQTTIYYKGYDNPYIHYKIGNGAWTSVPGVKMEATSEKPGYGYKITIDLGDADSLTACFNNGNGAWDSNNGNNYTFGVGDYTYSNGNITKIN